MTHAYEAHIQFQLNGFKIMKDNGQDVAIVIPAYGLCPTSPYPTQFRQAVATIQHLLLTRAPESVRNFHFTAVLFLAPYDYLT